MIPRIPGHVFCIENGYTGGKLDGHFGGIEWEEDVGGIESL